MTAAAPWTPYCGAAPAPDGLLMRWNLDPVLLVALAIACALWLRALGEYPAVRRALLAAWALLVLLYVSPFCALTSALFSVRVTHHLALTAVVAPLLALSWPARWPRLPGGVGGWAAIHALVFWVWHAPPAYGWALSSHAGYWLMQASLLLTALGLWRSARLASPPAAIAALLATMVQMGLLGALLAFSAGALYAPHLIGPLAWGLTPLEDQQLAGLIMWVPGAGLYLAAALALAVRLFAREAVPAA